MDSHIRQVETEAVGSQRILALLARGAILLMRHSKKARQALVRWQMRFTPNIYGDLFEKYMPDLLFRLPTGGATTAGCCVKRSNTGLKPEP
jgi:hypothetical protein